MSTSMRTTLQTVPESLPADHVTDAKVRLLSVGSTVDGPVPIWFVHLARSAEGSARVGVGGRVDKKGAGPEQKQSPRRGAASWPIDR
ncbi:hypothetical protein LSTR_LSTR004829 [Laodelphax striatellus]|uniref:Uncharacterized protein n=1 Tax=Laodelphax striatellus TaxID=195883 RepID=A0A482WI21_LAOST|nr:hypothetical protein LSTR_LSTR004829 [Laodelphax striatellus]